MIQSIMLFALGFLVAGLLSVLVAPAMWRRAERLTRRRVGARLARDGIIPAMIDRIKELFQGESG